MMDRSARALHEATALARTAHAVHRGDALADRLVGLLTRATFAGALTATQAHRLIDEVLAIKAANQRARDPEALLDGLETVVERLDFLG